MGGHSFVYFSGCASGSLIDYVGLPFYAQNINYLLSYSL